MSGAFSYPVEYQWTPAQLLQSGDSQTIIKFISITAYYFLTLELGFLLLILIGVLLARRHGRLALLLPLGYLIPTVVLGRFDSDPYAPFLLIWASIAVLAYRVFVTIIAPVWIVRSASEQARWRAGTIGLMTAVGILITAHIGHLITGMVAYGWEWSVTGFYYSISPELITLVGICLAMSLYKPVPSEQPAFQPDPVVMET